MEKKMLVDASEHNQLVIDLYRYVKTIEVGCQWHNEFLEQNEIPCVCFKRQSTTIEKLNANIKGSYEAELPFLVFYRDEVQDTRQTLEIVEPLSKIAEIFKNETDQGFPNLKITNDRIVPVSIEMTSTPVDATGVENNKAVFMASYKLRYRKKGKYE